MSEAIARIDFLITITSMRPPPNSPEGEAWEAGARQGYDWCAMEGALDAETIASAEARALAAEAQVASLKEALGYAHMGLSRIHNALLSNGPKQAAGEMVMHFRDRAAQALASLEPKDQLHEA